jgi:hypothetical protein
MNRSCASYTGIDFSATVLANDRRLRPDWTFICADASDPLDIRGQVVLCMDMLFHVMDEAKLESILRNLAKWTVEYLFVYNWWQSPFGESTTDGKYQVFRPLLRYSSLLAPLELIEEMRHDEIGALYVFRKPCSGSG